MLGWATRQERPSTAAGGLEQANDACAGPGSVLAAGLPPSLVACSFALDLAAFPHPEPLRSARNRCRPGGLHSPSAALIYAAAYVLVYRAVAAGAAVMTLAAAPSFGAGGRAETVLVVVRPTRCACSLSAARTLLRRSGAVAQLSARLRRSEAGVRRDAGSLACWRACAGRVFPFFLDQSGCMVDADAGPPLTAHASRSACCPVKRSCT